MYGIGQYSDFQKWLINEIRTDGYKSSWRIEQERRRAEEGRKFVTAPQIKARQKPQVNTEHRKETIRKSVRKHREGLMAQGVCRDCKKRPVKQGCTSCQLCLTARYARQKIRRAELGKAA